MEENLEKQAEQAVTALLPLETEALFNELGARLTAVGGDPTRGGDFALETSTEDSTFESAVDFSEVGKNFFNNLNQAAYNAICGSGDGSAEVKQLLGGTTTALAAGITGALVSSLGMAA